MTRSALCPICEEGQLHSHVEQLAVTHHGHEGVIESAWSVCDVCGSEQTTRAQSRRNKRAMVAFKKAAEGLLTGDEVRALRVQLDLTQADAARLFGGGQVAFSKYENDDVMQSEAMDKLLCAAGEVAGVLQYLRMRAGCVEQDQWAPAQWDAISDARQHQGQQECHLRLVSSREHDGGSYERRVA